MIYCNNISPTTTFKITDMYASNKRALQKYFKELYRISTADLYGIRNRCGMMKMELNPKLLFCTWSR